MNFGSRRFRNRILDMTEITLDGNSVSTQRFTMFSGTLDVQMSDPDTILVPGKAPEEHAHVVLGEHEYVQFIACMNAAPVRKIPVSVYDTSGEVLLKYRGDRSRNRSGNVAYSSQPCELLSHLKLGTDVVGRAEGVYLVLSSIPGLDRATDEDNRRAIFEADLERFRRQPLEPVRLYLSKELDELLTSFRPDFHSLFASVTVRPYALLVPSLVEHLMGLQIHGSKPGFHGALEFNAKCRIVKTVFASVQGHSPISASIRNESISLHCAPPRTPDAEKRCRASILVVVEHEPLGRRLVMKEKETGTAFVLSHLQTDIPQEKFETLFRSIQWLEKISAAKSAADLDDSAERVYHELFHPPLARCEIWSQRESDALIVQYASQIRTETSRVLSRLQTTDWMAAPAPARLCELSRAVSEAYTPMERS